MSDTQTVLEIINKVAAGVVATNAEDKFYRKFFLSVF